MKKTVYVDEDLSIDDSLLKSLKHYFGDQINIFEFQLHPQYMPLQINDDEMLIVIGLEQKFDNEFCRSLQKLGGAALVVLKNGDLFDKIQLTKEDIKKESISNELLLKLRILSLKQENDINFRNYQVELIESAKNLQEQRKRYEFISNVSQDLITLVNRNYIYEVTNKTYCLAHKLDQEAIVGKTVAEVWGNEVFYQRLKPVFDQCFAGEEIKMQSEFKFGNLGMRNMEICYYPYSNSEGEVTHAVIVTHDVSELKDVEEQLRKKDQLMFYQARFAQMGEMLNMIAHQWRQPLTAITASIGILEMDLIMGEVDTDKFQKELQDVKNYSAFLSNTINDFRNFFKSDKELKNVFFPDLITKVFEIVGKKLETENIETTIENKFEKSFSTYPNELMHVFLNILSNATDALLENKVEQPYIKLSAFERKGHLIITFLDNAGGVPEKDVDNIFNAYFSTKSANGTGLGLYMSKMIVEKNLGGEISVRNEAGGAKFTIELRLKEEEQKNG